MKEESKIPVCPVCLKIFSSQSVLKRHHREVHKQECNYPVPYSSETCFTHRCLESDYCGADGNAYRSRKDLMHHLETFHGMHFEKLYYILKTMEDFEDWKSNIENETNSHYRYHSRNKSSSGEKIYYKCNWSKLGPTKPNDTRKRRLKRGGSWKMNNSCTSSICVMKEKDKITVEWHNTHYGHDTNHPPRRSQKNNKGKRTDLDDKELDNEEGNTVYQIKSLDDSQKCPKLKEKSVTTLEETDAVTFEIVENQDKQVRTSLDVIFNDHKYC